ncbi:MAG: peptidoglycan D,D-transpeptidase FtsI family protein [Hyphomicrobium sp.]
MAPAADPVARQGAGPGALERQIIAARRPRPRLVAVTATLVFAMLGVGAQLVLLAARGDGTAGLNMLETVASSVARPDIVDRSGRLLATDIETQSLFADPAVILDRNEVVEKLQEILPGLDTTQLLATLADRSRRFVWVRRGLAPAVAQRVHDLGLPGLAFRSELRRAYPGGTLAGHLIGTVDIDNRGASGVERHIDQQIGVETLHGATRSERAAVRLSIDLGVQHSLEEELTRSMRRYGAPAAAGVVLDVTSGEVVGAASLPAVDPARPTAGTEGARLDRLSGGTFELGSIFKIATLAMAFDAGTASPESIFDVTEPIVEGAREIRDPHPAGRPLTVSEVFTRSSNVGAGLLALQMDAGRQRDFLARIGLLSPMATEAGPIAPPQVPARWDRLTQVTVSYGHGLAVAPLQFAAAAAALVNGGKYLAPTVLRRQPGSLPQGSDVVSAQTSRRIADLLRRNVIDPGGTGRRADVAGYKVGGKTGTAEMAVKGRYRKDLVISSFLGIFPSDRPRYVVLVSLFEPKPSSETDGEISAAVNAAPTVGRLIARVAPLLGILPDATATVAGD